MLKMLKSIKMKKQRKIVLLDFLQVVRKSVLRINIVKTHLIITISVMMESVC